MVEPRRLKGLYSSSFILYRPAEKTVVGSARDTEELVIQQFCLVSSCGRDEGLSGNIVVAALTRVRELDRGEFSSTTRTKKCESAIT